MANYEPKRPVLRGVDIEQEMADIHWDWLLLLDQGGMKDYIQGYPGEGPVRISPEDRREVSKIIKEPPF